MPTRWTCLVAGLLCGALIGCSEQRIVTISTRPVPATVRIEGIDKGPAPVTAPFIFDRAKTSYRVDLSRPGYKDQSIEISKRSEGTVIVDLKPMTRKITLNVRPFPANVSINGKQVTTSP